MKKLSSLIFILLVLTQWSIAQNSKIDSLKGLLVTAKEDTNKVNVLNALSKQFRKKANYEEAEKYANDALSLAKSLRFNSAQGWKKGEGDALYNLGYIFKGQNNLPKALENHLQALQKYQEADYKRGIGDTYNIIGIIYTMQSNYAEALKSYNASLSVREEMGDSESVALCYNNMGLIYEDQGNYPEALKYYLASLRARESLSNKKGNQPTYNNIGNLYTRQGNYPEALKNYSEALKIAEEMGDKQSAAITYGNIGHVYERQGNYSEAMKNQLAYLQISEANSDKLGMATAYSNLGELYGLQANYYESLKNFFAALKIQEEIGDKRGSAISCINIGEDYLNEKNFSECLKYLNRGLELARELDLKDAMMGAYADIADAYFQMNNYKKAYEYLELHAGIKDTLLNEENNRQIAQMKEQYESEKKDNEITVLNKDKKIERQKTANQKLIRNIFIVSLILVLIIAFLFINRLRLRQILKLQQIRNKISSDLHDDIGSTLSSIAIYSELANEEVKEKSDRASDLLQSINENSRGTIESMSDIVWAINPKNDRFDNILQRMRAFASGILEAKNIELTFGAATSLSQLKLSMEKRKNLYLIFKEAVNNVAKYSACRNCSIKLFMNGRIMDMEIADDGKGFDTVNHPAGNGLINMKKRTEEMNGSLSIQSMPGTGTTIKLSFPAT